MNHQTRTQIQEIKRKLISPITHQQEFTNDADVIAYAIKNLFETLKKQRLI